MKSLTTRLLLFLSMPLLLLCACHTTCPVGPQGSSELPSESALQPLALPEDAHVLAFDREHILFCRQENASDESAHGLYRYDVAGGETVRLWGYPAPAYSGDAAVLRGQDLYLLTEGAVCQVDVSSCAATEIAEVPTEAMVSLHAMDNGLVLHSILSEENGGLTYLVETLSLPEGQRRTVAKEQVRDNSGTAHLLRGRPGRDDLYLRSPAHVKRPGIPALDLSHRRDSAGPVRPGPGRSSPRVRRSGPGCCHRPGGAGGTASSSTPSTPGPGSWH